MKKTVAVFVVALCASLLIMQGCKKDTSLNAEQGEELSAGTATVFDKSSNAFGHELPGLDGDNGLFFFVGNSFFRQNWIAAPSSTTARDGLGPLFQARSCSSCHLLDGRGQPPLDPNGESIGLLMRMSIMGTGAHGEPLGDPTYGDQLQDNAIQGVSYEGKLNITYSELAGTYPDGNTYSLRVPNYTINQLQYGNLSATQFSPRVAQQVIGLGLLEAVPEQTILANADPADANGDGISGKANYVWDAQHQTTALGRFGWKANQPSIYQQVCGAFLGDMGITTPLFNIENCGAIPNCQNITNGGSPEIPNDDLNKIVIYSRTLAVPARRDWQEQDVLEGKKLFTALACDKCHTPKMQTGTADITALSNQTIRPYTDLLLHDMGNALADNRPDFLADGNEWRTQPLWGLGLIQTVNNHTFLLHDGRARNIEEAILWHGGEAEKSKEDFKKLSKTDRDKLILFLNTL